MKKLIILVLCFLSTPILGWQQKPMLGRLPYWPAFEQPVFLGLFNEGAGSKVYDLSGNGNTGIVDIGTLDWVAGVYGPAMHADADVRVALAKTVYLGNSNNSIPYSIVFSIKPESDGTHMTLLGVDTTNTDYLILYTTPKFRLLTHTGIIVEFTAAGALLGIQAVYAITHDGAGNYKLYKDGQWLQTTVAIKDYFNINCIFAGYNFEPSLYKFDGNCDYILCFSSIALTASEIAYLYRNPWPWFAPRNEWWGGITVTTAGGQIIIIMR